MPQREALSVKEARSSAVQSNITNILMIPAALSTQHYLIFIVKAVLDKNMLKS